MAPASCKTEIAYPSIVRNAGRCSFIISIEISPRHRNPWGPHGVPGANRGLGFGIVGLCFFTCSAGQRSDL